MKKVYSVVVAACFAVLTAHSQQIIPVPNDSAEISVMVTDEFDPNDIHIEVINNTANTVTFTWGMINYTAPAGWEVKLCDNNNCYDLLIHAGPYVSLPVNAGDTMDMKFQYTAHLITGTGNTNVYAYITGDSSNSVVFLNYKANLTAVSGIGETDGATQLSIYPNPVQSSLRINNANPSADFTYHVFDLKGSQMPVEVKQGGSAVEISTQALSPAEYIIYESDKKGNRKRSARFTKAE